MIATTRLAQVFFLALGTAALADQPLQVMIQAEGVALPEGSICRAVVRAEYRIVQPPITAKDRGRHVEVTDDMATFRAPAPEQHTWRFVAAKTSGNGRQSFDFVIPANMPKPHAGSRAAIYVPVSYTIAVPGFPEIKSESTYLIRLDDVTPGKPVSRCLRFELIDGGTSLRAGLLPTCNDSFENRGQPLATTD
jgi:hypothetical protein